MGSSSRGGKPSGKGKAKRGSNRREKPKPASKEDQRTEPFQRNLRVILSATEVAERADRCAHLLEQRDHKIEMAKAAAKHAKSEVDELDATIRRLGAEVRDKACYAQTDCVRVFDYVAGKVIETRKDTGEVIDERAMTFEERQMAFEPLGGKPGDKGDDDATQPAGAGSLDDDFDRDNDDSGDDAHA